ncbi:hypothetical protein HPB49_008896 [Dermacentor silvarum]|uniref:Uncharacterized protein n=1 Tax=Dermacentor silvarum TaxID=543639 RepID=A0ACB8CWH7_DERSI|nr:hypothetical protein HPB49_008896 [Dermacentor silvarum]
MMNLCSAISEPLDKYRNVQCHRNSVIFASGPVSQNVVHLGVTDPDDLQPSLPLRLFQSHFPIRKELINSEAKYIYVTRNPWDVCVSLYHMVTSLSAYRFQDGTFDDFFDAFLSEDVAGYGNYFNHVVSGYEVKDMNNVFFVTYENLTRDTRGTVLKLARFLGEATASKSPSCRPQNHSLKTLMVSLETRITTLKSLKKRWSFEPKKVI